MNNLSYKQHFTSRRPLGLWSKRNIELIARSQKEGRIKLPGLRETKTAKSDILWEQAYDQQGNVTLPDDFFQ